MFESLKGLNTPEKIQDFINSLPFNKEKKGETYRSASEALKAGEVHCFEGALIAALALWLNGERPLLLDLRTDKGDVDHVVALFKRNGRWGAISKTNHSVLRYRDPVYKSVRELAMSYFHEYFLDDGRKTLRKFSKPFDLSLSKHDWILGRENLSLLVDELDASPHEEILPKDIHLRNADKIEIEVQSKREW